MQSMRQQKGCINSLNLKLNLIFFICHKASLSISYCYYHDFCSRETYYIPLLLAWPHNTREVVFVTKIVSIVYPETEPCLVFCVVPQFVCMINCPHISFDGYNLSHVKDRFFQFCEELISTIICL